MNVGATMNTLYHRERILMSRLLLEMCRRASRYVEGKSLGAKMEAVLILIAIALGYMEGRPFTASKLAAYLDTPRTSVLRKLAQLKREGFVVQRGHTYVLNDDLLNSVGLEDTRAAIRMIRSLAEQLTQFDNEGVQNGHENRPQNHQPAHIKAA
jgi:biotin operon repressor